MSAEPNRRAIHRRMRRTYRWDAADERPVGELQVMAEVVNHGRSRRHAGWWSVVARSGGRQLVAEYRW